MVASVSPSCTKIPARSASSASVRLVLAMTFASAVIMDVRLREFKLITSLQNMRFLWLRLLYAALFFVMLLK